MNLYALPSHFSNRLPAAAVASPLLMQLIEMASREVDTQTGRMFYVEQAARYFGAQCIHELNVSDILAITELATDDGTETFTTVWDAADFRLYPWNSWPKNTIEKTLNGANCFPVCGASLYPYEYPQHIHSSHRKSRDVRVTGSWGYGDGARELPWDVSGATVTVDASATLAIADHDNVFESGMTILVESEQIFIGNANGTQLTVKRGVNGTTAAAHSGASAKIAAYPSLVNAAVINLAVDFYQQRAGDGDKSMERWADYEYERRFFADFVKTRQEQLDRMLGPYTLLAVA